MGTVYLATDPDLERQVALKILTDVGVPSELDNQANHTIDLRGGRPKEANGKLSSTLLDEARSLAKLAHPNVVAVHEIGTHDGQVFLVTEYVEGRDGRVWLGEQKTAMLAVADVLRLFHQAGLGLQAAHKAGLIHRDFKPENLLFGDDGRVRVADFGISGHQLVSSESLVRVAEVSGTPEYMAPELLKGLPATRASDTFSFAMTLIEALLGKRPEVESDSALEALRGQLVERGAATKVASILVAGLSQAPGDRPALNRLLEGLIPKRTVRRWPIVAATLGLGLGVGLAGLVVAKSAGRSRDCSAGSELYQWGDPQKAQLDQLAKASTRKQAPTVLAQVTSSLDGYVTKLEAFRVESCELHRDDKLAAHLYAARVACVERASFELGDLTKRFALGPDKNNFSQLPRKIDRLPNVLSCQTSDASLSASPKEAAARRKLQQRRLDINQTRSNDKLGAEREIEAMLAVAGDAKSLGDFETEARALRDVGGKLHQLGKLDDASEVFQRALDVAMAAKIHDVTVSAINDLAKIAIRRGDQRAAAQMSNIAKGVLSQFEARPQLTVTLLSTLGQIEKLKGNYQEAIERLLEARAALPLDATPGAILSVENRLASAYRYAKDPAKAKVHSKLAVAAAVEIYGAKNHVRVAEIEANVGLAMQELRDFEGALEVQRRTQKIIEEAYGPEHHVSVNGRNNIAVTLSLMGNNELARKVYLEVLELSEKGTLGSFRARALNNLGALARQDGDFAQAKTYIEQAIEVVRSRVGGNHPDIAVFLAELSQSEIRLGNLAAAARHLKDARTIHQSQENPNAQEIARLLSFEADLALDRKLFADSVAISQAALEHISRAELPRRLLGQVLLTMAQAENGRKQHENALKAAAGAIAIFEVEFKKPPAQSLAFSVFQKARAEYALGRNRNSAVAAANKALTSLTPKSGEVTKFAAPWAYDVKRWLRTKR